MDWPELDRLAHTLYGAWHRREFRGLPPVLLGDETPLEPDRLARIVLADIGHVRAWQRTHAPDATWETRRRGLANDVHRLLALVGVPSSPG